MLTYITKYDRLADPEEGKGFGWIWHVTIEVLRNFVCFMIIYRYVLTLGNVFCWRELTAGSCPSVGTSEKLYNCQVWMERMNNEFLCNYSNEKKVFRKLSITKLNVAFFLLNNVENDTWQNLEILSKFFLSNTLLSN